MLSFFVMQSLALQAAKNNPLAGSIGTTEHFFNIYTRPRFKVSRKEVPSSPFIEKRCCPFFIATKVIGKCPAGESSPAALVAVNEVKGRFGAIYPNEDVPQKKIPVTKASVMHTSNKIPKFPIDGKQLILVKLFLDSKIKKTVTVYNSLGDKELSLQEAEDSILCGDKGRHCGDVSFSQFEEILKFADAWSSTPGSR